MSKLYKLKRFIQNIWFFRKELIEYEPFDYQGFLLFNKRCLEGMYDFQANVDYFVSVNRDNHCLHMKRTIGRLDRLIEDEYDIRNMDLVGSDYVTSELVKDMDLPTIKMVNKHSNKVRADDLEAVGKFWRKHLLNCWH